MKTFTNDYQFNFLRIWAQIVCLLVGIGISGAVFGQQVKNLNRNTTFSTIQAAVNDAATVAGDVIEVSAGTYNENLTISKAITVQGVSAATTIIKAPYNNGNANTVLLGSGVTLKNLTITRDYGNTLEEWYACTVNQGINFNSTTNIKLEGLLIKGNRNGIYCANSQNITIVNCTIEDNRTGIQLTHDVSGLVMTNNIIRNNFTHGIGFTFDTALLTATNIKIQNNYIAGNWFSQLNFQRNIAPTPTNVGDFTGAVISCNWFGSATVGINAVSAGEPGYYTEGNPANSQIPSQFGGTNPNAGAPDRYIRGTQAEASGLPTHLPVLEVGTDTKDAVGFQPVPSICTPIINITRNTYFATIQAAINDASTIAGDTIEVSSGTYNQQVLVNKSLVIRGAGVTKPEINFTGTPALASTRLTVFEVTSPNVTIEGIKFKVDLTKIGSAILVSAANISNLTVKNNDFVPYRSGAYGPAYGLRNAISVNYGTYRVNASSPNGLLIKDNTVSYDLGVDNLPLTSDDAGFRAGVSIDEGGGVITGNTLQAISQDVEVRFASAGNVTVSNNIMNGGGSEISEHNAGAGTITIIGNTFNGAFGNTYSNQLRLKNNQANKTTIVSKNTFSNVIWGVSMENYKSVTLDSNTFTPKSGATAYQLITVNTKLNSSSSSTIVQTEIGATFTNNEFNGSGATGGKAISFFNQDSDNDVYGTFTIGTSGNENTFKAGIKDFIYLDNSTGSSNGYVFPGIAGLPNYPTTGSWPTTMAPWAENLNVRYNKFDLGTGLKLPTDMSFEERNTFETMLTHKPDNAVLGQISYFNPVHNLTQDTYFATIQPAITAAAAGDTLELSEWTFAEGITINKALTIQGVDSANVILNGSSIADANGITLANNVQNITIKKLTIKNFKGSGAAGSGIFGLGNSNLTIDQVVVDGNQGRGGIYLGGGGGIQNVTIKNSISKNHAVAASRGIVIWDGFKKNITITNNKVYNNNCCGIELQDGTASGVTITDNLVIGNVDNGLGLTGLTGGAGANLISNNTVINNGRFGIEIKNPNGTGLSSGDGSVLVKGNTVSFSASGAMNNRDHAGISVYRRAFLVNNTENYSNIPTGVVIDSNTVTGFRHLNSSESKGYGIVVEGTNHTVKKNTVGNNDFGIHEQGGLHPNANYVADNAGDADQADTKSLNYFGRGNSPVACGNTFIDNIFNANLVTNMNTAVGSNSFELVVNKRNKETFCSIQTAIDDSNTMNGDTLIVNAGTFIENITVSKSLALLGPNANINPNTGIRVDEAIIRPAVRQTSLEGSTSGTIIRVAGTGHLNVIIKGFKLDGNNPSLTGGRTLNGVKVHTGAGIVNSIGSFDTNPGGSDATMIIQNNIIQNVERYGVLADGTTPAIAIAGTNVSYNKFDNIPSGDGFGGGRGRAAAFEENHYGTFAYNVVTRANVGWQDDNYYLASPGAGTIVEHNNIRTYRRGIFHNLQYQSATGARITNNTITKETSGDFAAHADNFGIELASIQNTVNVTADSNTVTGMKYGILLWNIPSTGTVKVAKGTLTGNQYGIYATSNDPQFAGAGSASNSIVSGVSVVNSTTAGITVDNSINNSATSIALTDSTIISGGPKGLVLTGANTTISGGTLNNTVFTGQTGNYIELVNSTANIDGGGAYFGGKKAVVMTQVERTALEGKLLHKPDNVALGKICLPSVATLSIKSGSPSTYCNGGSTTLIVDIISATGPSTLVYTDGTTQTTVNSYVSGANINISPTTTKTYSIVSITDASGCATSTGFTGTPTVTVNPIPTKPTITPTAIAICQGTSTTLTASACAGGTLNWTGGLTGTSISVSITKSYKVACTQLGCTSDSSDVATVTVNPIPTKPTITPANTAICIGSSTTLTASACAGGTLNWTGGLTGTSITVSPTETKMYKVACTQLDCTSDSSSVTTITVNPIPTTPVIAASSLELCMGESATLTVSACAGGIVKWTGDLSGSSITISPTASKSYKATCTQLNCTSDSSEVATVTVKPTPAAPTILADNSTICNGETVLLTGSCETGTFAWVVTSIPGVISERPTSNRTISTPGTYSATCTYNGCVSAEGSITITSGSCKFLTISPSNPTICPGKSITLTTSGCNAGNITWAGGATGAGTSITVSPTVATTYLATCSSGGSATVTVNVAESSVSVTNNVSTGVVLVKVAQTIESNKKVGNPAFTPMPNVTYQAGGSIVLNPGFVVEAGAVFKAEIQVCN
ncbi:right-handed parallel beta-helix repeat-containing protein [Emticicia agri]|uniref:Right handed beta helix domain-containing protein n=1 Tax=Emticicia agri TaxID=2492393 RepID=A0A4Q5LT88_9BACT|nr:right-handed parallel beta-helix repeat-containing protein [Emticicia agri]RYU92762.1 hypothetical protein EWM59_25500 [Emticicia agri]